MFIDQSSDASHRTSQIRCSSTEKTIRCCLCPTITFCRRPIGNACFIVLSCIEGRGFTSFLASLRAHGSDLIFVGSCYRSIRLQTGMLRKHIPGEKYEFGIKTSRLTSCRIVGSPHSPFRLSESPTTEQLQIAKPFGDL